MDLQSLIDRYVLIYTTGGDVKYPTLIYVREVVTLSNRVFIVGKQPEQLVGKDNWLAKSDTHIAWDSVAQFHVYESLASFEQTFDTKDGQGFFNFFK